MRCTIFIGNLTDAIQYMDLYRIFKKYSRYAQYPRINIIDRLNTHKQHHEAGFNCSKNCPYEVKAKTIFDPPTFRYFAFIQFHDEDEAVAAWCHEHLRIVQGTTIEVEYSKSAKMCSGSCYQKIKSGSFIHPDHLSN